MGTAGRLLAGPPGCVRALRRALLAAILVQAAPLPAQRPVTPAPAYEEGIFELVAPTMQTTQLVVLVSPRGVFLLPLRATLEPLGVPLTIAVDSQLARVTRPGGIGVATLRWGARAGLVVTDSVRVDPADVVVRGAEVYVAAPQLARLIEGTVDVDLATLSVHAARTAGFPAQLLANVRQRRGEALRQGARDAVVPVTVPFHPTTGFGVVEWSVSGSGTPLGMPNSVDTRAGMGLFGGMLKTAAALTLPLGGRRVSASYGEMSYHRVFPDGTLLRQVRIGDIFSDGAVARPLRGLAISNSPFIRSQRFGELPFSRPLPPGWEYDVFEGERLVGYADASTRRGVAVPVQYGMTPLHVRLYGPAGEVVESTVSFVIPVDQLPAGQWEYSLGGGRCAVGQCDGVAYADVRRGITPYLTLQLGADETSDSSTRNVRPYGAVSYLPAPGWTTQMQARRAAFLRGSVQRYSTGGVSGGGSFGVNAAGEGGTAIGRDSGATLFAQASVDLLHVFHRLGDRSLTFAGRVDRPRAGGAGRWDVATYFPIQRGILELGVQSDPLANLPAQATGVPVLRVAPTLTLTRRRGRLGSPVLRTEAGFQGGSLAQWDVGLSLQPGRGNANLSLRHMIGTPGTQLNIGGNLTIGAVRTVSRMTGRGGQLAGAYSGSGAVAFGSVRRATTLPYGGLGLSGVEGVVFRDLNGDGRLDAGDTPAAGVLVAMGALRTTTDSSGRYSSWNLLPYEAIGIQVDSLSLDDPSWVPALSMRTLRPSPQQFTRVDFPLVRTREVIGRLVGPPGTALGGVAIELRGEGSGALQVVRTFTDGAFYVGRVRPGRYVVALAEASRRVLGAELVGSTIVIVPATGDEVVEVPPFQLRPVAKP